MAWFIKGLLMYLCMAFALAMWQPNVVFGVDGVNKGGNLMSWFDVDYNSYSGSMVLNNQNFSNDVANQVYGPDGLQSVPDRGTGFLSFIDPIFQILKMAGLILNVLFSPIILLVNGVPGLPFGVLFLIGIVPVFLLLISIIAWFRSGVV